MTNKYLEKGFSLLEMLVVLAVFAVIISVATTLFISLIDRQRNIMAEQEMISQASLAVEKMARHIRDAKIDTSGSCTGQSGRIYLLTHEIDGFYGGIKFINQDDVCQEFYVDDNLLLKEVIGQNSPQNIFSEKFTILYLRFALNGRQALQFVSESDLEKPRVSFALNIKKLIDQVAFIKKPALTLNIAQAQVFEGIPTCGDGVCDPGEIIYCSNRCPLLDDCQACPSDPPTSTGLSCMNNICIANPSGNDNCILNTPCGFTPPPNTGYSCVNGTCLENPEGNDSCLLGASCNGSPSGPGPNSIPPEIVIQTTVSRP